MAQHHVYNDGNAFVSEKRSIEVAKKKASIVSKISADTAVRKPMVSTFQRLKTRLHGMDVYSRHKEFINNYVLYHRGATAVFQRDATNDRSIHDVIKDNHRFLWNDEDITNASTSGNSVDESQRIWEARLAKKYYDKLFKEYCIADLSHYQSNKIAMRWRVEREVFTGKGQFICGDKRCDERENLSSWEVNFAYVEHGERRNALVKLRLCPNCSAKLNFHSKKRLIKKEKKEVKRLKRNYRTEEKRKHKKNRKRDNDSSSTSSIDEENEVNKELTSKGIVVKSEPHDVDTSITDGAAKDGEKTATSASKIWSGKVPTEEVEKTLEDEFDEFIDDLLM